MSRPTTLGLGLALAAVVAVAVPAAHGAPPCPYITDAAGDQVLLPLVEAPASESVDILAGNVTTTKDSVVATIRLRDLDLERPTNASGVQFEAWLGTKQVTFLLVGQHYPDGDLAELRKMGTTLGNETASAGSSQHLAWIAVVFDEDRSLVTLTAPLAAFGWGLRRGTRVDEVQLASAVSVGSSGEPTDDVDGRSKMRFADSTWVDTARSTRPYVVGDRGCTFPR